VVLVTRGAIDLNCLVYTDSLLDSGANLRSLDDVLFVANSLLDDGTAGRSLDGGLGYADVLTVTRLGSSAVTTFNSVDRRDRVLWAGLGPVMVVVVSVSVNLDASIRVRGSGRSLRVGGTVWFLRVGRARGSGLLLLELFVVVLLTMDTGTAVKVLFLGDENLFLAVAVLLPSGRKFGRGGGVR